MMGVSKTKTWAFLFFIYLLIGCAENSQTPPPKASHGLMDLSSWDFKSDGNINLNGEWEFYLQMFVSPQTFAAGTQPEKTGFFNLPGIWNKYLLNAKPLQGNGYATFRLRVKMPEDRAIKAIRIKNQSSAYTLYINGNVIAKNGSVGKNSQDTIPQYMLQQNPFDNKGKDLDIVLHAANFNHRKGGIWNTIQMGRDDVLRSGYHLQWIFDLSLMGCLFVMGTYYLSLFVLFKEDRSTLYLAVFTLTIALRIWVTGNYYLTQIFPGLPWEPAYKIELWTIIVGPAGLLLFVKSVFIPKEKDYICAALIALMSVFFIVTLVSPAQISSHLVVPCQVTILLIFGYSLFIILRPFFMEIKKRRSC